MTMVDPSNVNPGRQANTPSWASLVPGAQPVSGQGAPAAPEPTQAPSADPFSGGINDTDMKSLLNGNVIPFLTTLLQGGVEEFNRGGPRREDFATEDEWYVAQQKYNPIEAQAELAALAFDIAKAQELGTGSLTLDDGTVITSDMLNHPDPAVAKQYRTEWDNRARESFNGYNDWVNKTGLDQWKIDLEGASFENDRRQAEYTNAITKIRETNDWDTLNLGRTSDMINRELSGMAESRARADLQTRAALEAAPYNTGGKTEFTPRDIGALGIEAGRMAGITADEVAMRYPSTTTIDPASILADYDARYGVGQGPLPQVPGLSQTPASFPALPQYVGAPAAPQMQAPVPYAASALPPNIAANPQEAAAQAAAQRARMALGRMF